MRNKVWPYPMAPKPPGIEPIMGDVNHEGMELELMLAGEKPLAMFYCSTSKGVSYEQIPEQRFDAYVESGRFVKEEMTFDVAPEVSVRYVLYALKGEEWRISALKLVLREMKRTGKAGQEGIDRITGALLGYSEEEIDEYIKQGTLYGAGG